MRLSEIEPINKSTRTVVQSARSRAMEQTGQSPIGLRQSPEARERAIREAVLSFSYPYPLRYERSPKQRGKKIPGWENLAAHKLAADLQLSADYISGGLRGKWKFPVRTMNRVCQALGWPLLYLMARVQDAEELWGLQVQKQREMGKVRRFCGNLRAGE